MSDTSSPDSCSCVFSEDSGTGDWRDDIGVSATSRCVVGLSPASFCSMFTICVTWIYSEYRYSRRFTADTLRHAVIFDPVTLKVSRGQTRWQIWSKSNNADWSYCRFNVCNFDAIRVLDLTRSGFSWFSGLPMLFMIQTIPNFQREGAVLYHLLLRFREQPVQNVGRSYLNRQRSQRTVRFHIWCFVSKPECLKMDCVKNRRQISHFLIPPSKIRGGVSEMSRIHVLVIHSFIFV